MRAVAVVCRLLLRCSSEQQQQQLRRMLLRDARGANKYARAVRIRSRYAAVMRARARAARLLRSLLHGARAPDASHAAHRTRTDVVRAARSISYNGARVRVHYP